MDCGSARVQSRAHSGNIESLVVLRGQHLQQQRLSRAGPTDHQARTVARVNRAAEALAGVLDRCRGVSLNLRVGRKDALVAFRKLAQRMSGCRLRGWHRRKCPVLINRLAALNRRHARALALRAKGRGPSS